MLPNYLLQATKIKIKKSFYGPQNIRTFPYQNCTAYLMETTKVKRKEPKCGSGSNRTSIEQNWKCTVLMACTRWNDMF